MVQNSANYILKVFALKNSYISFCHFAMRCASEAGGFDYSRFSRRGAKVKTQKYDSNAQRRMYSPLHLHCIAFFYLANVNFFNDQNLFFLLFFLAVYILSCNSNNITENNAMGKYFDSAAMDGCFALYDNGQGHFTIYNLKRFRDSAFSPASTFKIVNSLIGLQTGKVTDEHMVIKWDSVKRWNEDWNKDLTMEEAFRVSAVPYYQELARRIGRDTMKKWIDSLGYGNRDINGPIDSFWLNNHLKITPDEELGLVKKLYFDQLPFFRRNAEIVRKMMLREDNANYRLSYKTGLGKNR